jgi:hypothetical protein
MARKLSLVYTLALFIALCTILVPAVEANNIVNHARMMRKRTGLGVIQERDILDPTAPVIGAGLDPNAPSGILPTPSVTDTTKIDPTASTDPTDPDATVSFFLNLFSYNAIFF